MFPKTLTVKKNKFRKIHRKGIFAYNIKKLIRVSQNIRITSKKTELFGISKVIKQRKYHIKNIKHISLITKKREKQLKLKNIVKCRHHFINDVSVKSIIQLKKKGINLKKRSRLRKALKEKITYNKLKNLLVIDFLKTTRMSLGEKIAKDDFNVHINSFIIGTRENHVIYNMTIILLNLKTLLKLLAVRIAYKKTVLINYAANKKEKAVLKRNRIQDYAKGSFIVTWNKWRGGALTNFKLIAKRIISKINNNFVTPHKLHSKIDYPQNYPQIPSLFISTRENHWALNETKLLKIQSVQFFESTYNNSFGNLNIASNTTYYSLRSLTGLFVECVSVIKQTQKLFHKNKLLLRIQKKSLHKVNFGIFNKISKK